MQDSRLSAMRVTVEASQLQTKLTTLLDTSSVGTQEQVSRHLETQQSS